MAVANASWGKVSLVGPGTKETILVGAAGKAIVVPPKSSGYISTGITKGAVFKSGPAIVTPFLPAPAPEPAWNSYAPIAPAYGAGAGYGAGVGYGVGVGYGLAGGYGKGETLIKGPSGSIEAGPGKAIVVGPTGPNYGGYDGGYEGGYGGGYEGGYGGGYEGGYGGGYEGSYGGGYEGDDNDDGQWRGDGGYGKKW